MENGPVQDRSCTDVLFCLVFIIFIAGMAAVTGYVMLYGNPQLLLSTFDGDGNGFGLNDTTKNYPYLYFPVIDLEAAKQAYS
jgi:choline transporter-like protein 2/4/5